MRPAYPQESKLICHKKKGLLQMTIPQSRTSPTSRLGKSDRKKDNEQGLPSIEDHRRTDSLMLGK